jgi:L-ascorbate metabolism protein UlaG (beta-lactamase superfamily)
MQIRWFGQSAFQLAGAERTVFIDPFGAMDGIAARGMRFDYPPIEGVEADLLLVTHEHGDHNGVEVVGGSPQTIRSTTGTFDSPIGEVVGIASEHDDVAGTKRGPNTIFCFSLDGLRFCHFGDFGQAALRPEQQQAIGKVDVLFVPVGDMATIGGAAAAAIVRTLSPSVVVPMHYRTPALSFLEPVDAFLDAVDAPVERIESSELDSSFVDERSGRQAVALLAPPVRVGAVSS